MVFVHSTGTNELLAMYIAEGIQVIRANYQWIQSGRNVQLYAWETQCVVIGPEIHFITMLLYVKIH